ncbi:biopolymer transporter ExbD, partial [Escherichia coli]|nr:biopolymer transporter ExbD [Escherichia coli]
MSVGGGGDDGPMMEINTTPLIDVMLVLLIMIIMTIPIQTHAVKVDLPQSNSKPQNIVEPEKNKVYIDAQGQVYWN